MSIMSLDPQLLEVLVCPQDKGPLTYIEKDEVLVNERLGIAYPIEVGIPVMLVARSYPWTPNS
ncbi:Trm112 family protein [Corynebacterium flavescens]|uniref:Trm112 family protein n=1 Tax=Corynebacterium flavescens TaxID=28028 RepID=UPI00289A3A59|nr:Trm112 family protein [Corynebacterium flavescens]